MAGRNTTPEHVLQPSDYDSVVGLLKVTENAGEKFLSIPEGVKIAPVEALGALVRFAQNHRNETAHMNINGREISMPGFLAVEIPAEKVPEYYNAVFKGVEPC